MNETMDTKVGNTIERLYRVPDEDCLALLLGVANSRGVAVSRPGRSRRQVALRGPAVEVDAVANEIRKLSLRLLVRRFQTIEDLLRENGMPVPAAVIRALAMTEAKLAVAGIQDSASVPRESQEQGG